MKTRKFYIGKSSKYGNLVTVSDELTQINESQFFEMIENSLVEQDAEKYREQANRIGNLKIGVSIGGDYYKIKDSN